MRKYARFIKLIRIKVSRYNKFVVAVAGFTAALALAFSDGTVDGAEFAGLVSTGIAALGVFGVRNRTLDEVKSMADDVKGDDQ